MSVGSVFGQNFNLNRIEGKEKIYVHKFSYFGDDYADLHRSGDTPCLDNLNVASSNVNRGWIDVETDAHPDANNRPTNLIFSINDDGTTKRYVAVDTEYYDNNHNKFNTNQYYGTYEVLSTQNYDDAPEINQRASCVSIEVDANTTQGHLSISVTRGHGSADPVELRIEDAAGNAVKQWDLRGSDSDVIRHRDGYHSDYLQNETIHMWWGEGVSFSKKHINLARIFYGGRRNDLRYNTQYRIVYEDAAGVETEIPYKTPQRVSRPYFSVRQVYGGGNLRYHGWVVFEATFGNLRDDDNGEIRLYGRNQRSNHRRTDQWYNYWQNEFTNGRRYYYVNIADAPGVGKASLDYYRDGYKTYFSFHFNRDDHGGRDDYHLEVGAVDAMMRLRSFRLRRWTGGGVRMDWNIQDRRDLTYNRRIDGSRNGYDESFTDKREWGTNNFNGTRYTFRQARVSIRWFDGGRARWDRELVDFTIQPNDPDDFNWHDNNGSFWTWLDRERRSDQPWHWR